MIYVLDKDTLNKSINKLYYVKGIIAGLTNLNPLPLNISPQVQDIIELLEKMRDCEVQMKEGD